MFICGIVLWCTDALKPRLESGTVTADLTTTVTHKYKLLINDVKPVQSLSYGCNHSTKSLII